MKRQIENQKINSNPSFIPIVGIDLGTTNSAVACIRNGQAHIIPSSQNHRLIPSVVLIDPDERVIVGEDARGALVAMPDRTIAAVKRKMGSDQPIPLAGQQLLPEEISALILKELKTYVDDFYGEGEKEAVITVPAYFTDTQRRATKKAGELAGFIVERIINEPTAAALAFGLEHLNEDRVFLVYDLGGGTFDVSVVEMMSGLLEVRASAGNNHLGGEDFDWKLVDLFARQIIAEHAIDPREDIRAKALLKEEAERVKKELSFESSVRVQLPLVTVKDNSPVGLTTEVSRSQLVELIDEQLDETFKAILKVLQEAGLNPADVDEVLLVGGSTRIPRVHEKITALFGKPPRTDINPDEAVALGAAVQAGLKSGLLTDSGLIATDVAPYSMGIAVLTVARNGRERPGGFAPVIERNTTIPVTRSQTFFTSSPGQTAVNIEVYQGEHEWVKHNHLLGKFSLEGIPENWTDQEKIEVTFRYNMNGILETTAKCVSTDKAMSVILQDAIDRNSQESFRDSLSRLEKLQNNANIEEEIDEESDELAESFLDYLNELEAETIELEDDIANEPDIYSQVNEETERLLARAKHLAAASDTNLQSKALHIVELLENSYNQTLPERQDIIDEATDLLIELEL